MHFKQLEQLTKDSFNLSTIVYAEETEQSVLDNLMHPGVHSVNSIKLAHYTQEPPCKRREVLFYSPSIMRENRSELIFRSTVIFYHRRIFDLRDVLQGFR